MELSPQAVSIHPVIEGPRACVKCGYSITGLFTNGHCPECGTPVAESLRGDLLQHAGKDYLKTILTGHSWVLNGVLAIIVVQVATMLGSITAAMRGATTPPREFTAILSLVGLAVSVWIFLGYVKLTEPDPQFTGLERPDTARQLVRLSAIVTIIVGVIASVLYLSTSLSGVVVLILGALQLVGLAAFVLQFLAMMNYTIWLGRRIPDTWIVRRASMYRWLLPLIAVVGAVALFLGPLVALIMYWNLLDRMRKHLKSIVANGQPASLRGM